MDLELDEGEYKRIYATFNTSKVITISATASTPTVSSPLDVSGASFTFGMKADRSDTAFVAQVKNSDFVTTNAATGVIRWDLDATALATPDSYMGQLKTTYNATDVDKQLITIWVREAVN